MARSNPARRQAQPKQNTFFGGAAILAVGIMVVKVIGMFYKIPLINIIGEQGTADFNNAYNIYAVLLTISTAGLPVAVSKLVSEANALGRRNQVQRIFRLALAVFLSLGVVSFLVMYLKADWLAGLMNDKMAAAGIKALAPAVICVGCLSAFRGYSQGHSNMVPTAVSQIIEAMCKLVVGLGLAYWLIKANQPPHIAAAGAITGVTIGTVLALVYMALNYVWGRMGEPRLGPDEADSNGTIFRDLMKIAIPITLSSSMVGIVTVIDSALVQGQIQRALLENPDSWALYSGFIDFEPLKQAVTAWTATLTSSGGATMAALSQQVELELKAGTALSTAQTLSTTLESISRTLYGNYGGALNIYNLPTSLMAAITASVIPAVSAARARRDRKGASRIANSALRITALLACPMSMGLFVLGKPIMKLLFKSLNADLAGPLLSTLGLASACVCLMLVCNSILQAHGFINLPVLVMLVGGLVKIVVNYNAVGNAKIGIFGAPYGNVLCFSLCLVLDLVLIARVIPNRPKYGQVFLKPVAASAVMGLAAWAVYGLLSKLLSADQVSEAGETIKVLSSSGNAFATLAAIGVAVVIYGILVVVLGAITRQDLQLMPKGDKIAEFLHL